MFSLNLYCVFTFFLVSAQYSRNDRFNRSKLNISTSLSTIRTKAIPASKECIGHMTKSDTLKIVELLNNDRVNMVDVHVSFSNTSQDKLLFSDFHVLLMNPIGREILYALDREKFFTWTLKAGIENFELHFKESLNECIINGGKDVRNFILNNTQHIVSSVFQTTNYKVCSSYKETSSGEVFRHCCQMTNFSLKFNDECPQGNAPIFGRTFWIATHVVMMVFAIFFFIWLFFVLLLRTEFDCKHSEYYMLEESMMSPSFIARKIIWDENGRFVSIIRSLVLVVVFSSFQYFRFKREEFSLNFFALLFAVWGFFFFTSYFHRDDTEDSHILSLSKDASDIWYVILQYNILVLLDDSLSTFPNGLGKEFDLIIEIITFAFNKRHLKNVIEKLFNCCLEFVQNSCRCLKLVGKCISYIISFLLFIILFFGAYVFAILQISFYLLFSTFSLLCMIYNLEYTSSHSLLDWVLIPSGLLVFHFLTLYTLTQGIQSLFLGLLFNFSYVFPYFAFSCVLTFYCCNYWKSMEEKYLILKRLIYNECRRIRPANDGCIPNRHSERKQEEKLLPVLHKMLYEKIREKLLPYPTNLFYFAIKMHWAITFLIVFINLLKLLNESDIPSVISVVTTASISVVPHVFSMVGLGTSKENKKAWKKKMRLKVKYMVKDLVHEHPKYATWFIIEENKKTVRCHNIVVASELDHIISVRNISTTNLLQDICE